MNSASLQDIAERDTQARSVGFAELRLQVGRPFEALEDPGFLVQQADRHLGAGSPSSLMHLVRSPLPLYHRSILSHVVSEEYAGIRRVLPSRSFSWKFRRGCETIS
jgi:hypothetical protein